MAPWTPQRWCKTIQSNMRRQVAMTPKMTVSTKTKYSGQPIRLNWGKVYRQDIHHAHVSLKAFRRAGVHNQALCDNAQMWNASVVQQNNHQKLHDHPSGSNTSPKPGQQCPSTCQDGPLLAIRSHQCACVGNERCWKRKSDDGSWNRTANVVVELQLESHRAYNDCTLRFDASTSHNNNFQNKLVSVTGRREIYGTRHKSVITGAHSGTGL